MSYVGSKLTHMCETMITQDVKKNQVDQNHMRESCLKRPTISRIDANLVKKENKERIFISDTTN